MSKFKFKTCTGIIKKLELTWAGRHGEGSKSRGWGSGHKPWPWHPRGTISRDHWRSCKAQNDFRFELYCAKISSFQLKFLYKLFQLQRQCTWYIGWRGDANIFHNDRIQTVIIGTQVTSHTKTLLCNTQEIIQLIIVWYFFLF